MKINHVTPSTARTLSADDITMYTLAESVVHFNDFDSFCHWLFTLNATQLLPMVKYYTTDSQVHITCEFPFIVTINSMTVSHPDPDAYRNKLTFHSCRPPGDIYLVILKKWAVNLKDQNVNN